jgi:hypothetical protein
MVATICNNHSGGCNKLQQSSKWLLQAVATIQMIAKATAVI